MIKFNPKPDHIKPELDHIEVLISGAQTEEDAIAQLFEKLIPEFVKRPGVKFEWRVKPETDRKYNPENWWAYARVKFL